MDHQMYAEAEALRFDKVTAKIANLSFVPFSVSKTQVAFKEEYFLGNEKCVRYQLLEMDTGKLSLLFEPGLLANLLETEASRLLITPLTLGPEGLTFAWENTVYRMKEDELHLLYRQEPKDLLVSPSEKWGAYAEEGNIFFKDLVTGVAQQLTHDAEALYGYGDPAQGDGRYLSNKLGGNHPLLGGIWSPEGTKLLTYRLDQRQVKPMYLLQSTTSESVRPILHAYRYALPGDEDVAMVEFFVFDPAAGTHVKIQLPPVACSFLQPIGPYIQMAGWSIEGERILLYSTDRQYHTLSVYVANPQTGEAALLFEEETDTFLFFDYQRIYHQLPGEHTNPVNRQFWCSDVLDTLFWLSRRDGYFHIYSYDVTGKRPCRQLTRGAYEVRQILHLDVKTQTLYLMAAGKEVGSNPYDSYPYRLDLTTGDMTLLSSERGHHRGYVSPDGERMLLSVSRPDKPQATWLSDTQGELIREVQRCDASRLEALGLAVPMEMEFLSGDGKDIIYGMVLFPRDIDPEKKYPLVEYYYGGVQTTVTPRTFAGMLATGYMQSLTRLGMVTLILDGRGTPGRGKAFHDAFYRRLAACAGMDDHEAAIRQLCELHPLIDGERIGVWGHSGGGYAALRCLADKPYLYKAAVSAAGNHFQELYLADWSERFMGVFDQSLWASQSVLERIHQIQGRLLLIHGELDENVHPAHTMRIVDALIRHDKDFEMLILPNMHHSLDSPYYFKKILYFFSSL